MGKKRADAEQQGQPDKPNQKGSFLHPWMLGLALVAAFVGYKFLTYDGGDYDYSTPSSTNATAGAGSSNPNKVGTITMPTLPNFATAGQYDKETIEERLQVLINEHPRAEIYADLRELADNGEIQLLVRNLKGSFAYFGVEETDEGVLKPTIMYDAYTLAMLDDDPVPIAIFMEAMVHEYQHYLQWLAADDPAEKASFRYSGEDYQGWPEERCESTWRHEREVLTKQCPLISEWGIMEYYPMIQSCEPKHLDEANLFVLNQMMAQRKTGCEDKWTTLADLNAGQPRNYGTLTDVPVLPTYHSSVHPQAAANALGTYENLILQERLRILVQSHPHEDVRETLNSLILQGEIGTNFDPANEAVATFGLWPSELVTQTSMPMEKDWYAVLGLEAERLANINSPEEVVFAWLVLYHEYQHIVQWQEDPSGTAAMFAPKVEGHRMTAHECRTLWRHEHEAYSKECQLAQEWGAIDLLWDGTLCTDDFTSSLLKVYSDSAADVHAEDCVPQWKKLAAADITTDAPATTL